MPDFNPKIIVDAGANIGMASICFARRYPLATIITIEPDHRTSQRFLEPFPRSSILPVEAALLKEGREVSLGISYAHPKRAFELVDSGPTRVVQQR
jgi:FkbM family methyltransferase